RRTPKLRPPPAATATMIPAAQPASELQFLSGAAPTGLPVGAAPLLFPRRYTTKETIMTAQPSDDLLDRVRKLLAKAEEEGATPAEAEALTAKAAELMARYGIDRARLGALHPETDRPADRIFDLDNPWAGVKAHLLAGLAIALRCQCILLRR